MVKKMTNVFSTLQFHLAKQKTPEKAEFGAASLKLLRKRMFWRFVSQEQRTKDVNEFINSLSNRAFEQNIDMILLQVSTSKAECQKYVSDNAQVMAVFKRLPRLGQFGSRTTEYVKKARRKYQITR